MRFASDFLKSKTTNLMWVTLATAAWGYFETKWPGYVNFLIAFLGAAVAFLRDAHIKGTEEVAVVLMAIYERTHPDHDGEADA